MTYTGLHLIFAPGTNDSYTLTIITYGSGATNIISGTLGGTPSSTLDSIALFNNNGGPGGSHNVFFNSLSVANFTPITYTINTSSSPAGGGSTSGGGTETCGTTVTVVATANIGYDFVNWTEGGMVASTSASYSFTANTNRTLAANFTPTVCSFTLSSTGTNMSAAEGSGSVGVSTGSGCSWTATSNVGWLTITSGSSGTGNGTVNYAVDVNPGAALRIRTMTIAGQTFTVTQAGGPTPPVVVLTAPTSGIASNTIVVSATATDTVGVVRVEFYRDANVLLGTVTTPPYSVNFDTTTVADGSHCFYAKAYNPAGNVGSSATNCVIVDRNPPSVPLGLTARTVATNQINLSWSASSDSGSGVASYRVFRDGEQIGTTAGTTYIDIGLAAKTVYCYAVAAQDELGHVSAPSADACAQTFVTAVSALGRYNGLAIQTNAPTHASSGSIKLVVSKNEPFAASLSLGGVRSAFKGQFDLSGNATNLVTRTGLNPLRVILHLDLVNSTDQITGSVSDGGFTSEVLADRQVFSAKARCPLAGTFTVVLEPPEGTDPSLPEGFGYGTLTVTPTGLGRVSGVLADGTKINVSVPLSKHGTWPLYQVLYKNQGACIGWVTFGTNSSVGATVDWFRPPLPASPFFLAGFTTNVTLLGEKYVSPTNGGPSVAGTNVVMLGGGNLVSSIVETVLVSDVGSVAVFSPNAENLQMKIRTTTGQFSGSFTHPVLGKTVTFNGLVLQLDGTGAGYFLGNSASGFVVFEPTP